MLIAALIFVISMAATIQFGVLSWRAGLIRIAATRLRAEMDAKIQVGSNLLKNNNFLDVEVYQKLCPNVSGEPAPNLGPVATLLQFPQTDELRWRVRHLRHGLSGRWTFAPAMPQSSLVQRLERNQAFAIQARSY